MRRQIIKTRSDRPYRIARIVVTLVVIAILAWLAYAYWWRPSHATHALVPLSATMQDLANFSRNPQVPIDVS